MTVPYKPPSYKGRSYYCPSCNAFAHQQWYSIYYHEAGFRDVNGLEIAFCSHCNHFSLWFNQKMIYPDTKTVQLPNTDLNDDIKADYLEAREIVNKSPRGASALLRLALQKLCKQLGKSGVNINDDIAALVKEGLSVNIQKALDIVRVIGNNAVHPGQLDLTDNIETANKLFDLVNIIAQVMITQPKEIDSLYEVLPESQKKAIKDRDK